MDGTLWDSADGVAKSWTEVMQREYNKNIVITEDDIKGIMGKTMDAIAVALFPQIEPNVRTPLMEQCFADENEYLRVHGGKLYDGLEDVWTRLLEDGYYLYIVSNCQSGYIEAFLEYYGFAHYFEDIECFGNNGLQKGDNIRAVVNRNELDAAVYVGDIQGDYDASKSAGVPFIHAAYGFGEIDEKVPAIAAFTELTEVVGDVI